MWRTTMNDLVDLAKKKKTARVRELNDALRRTLVGGRVVLTARVAALPEETRAAVLQSVRGFDDSAFDASNDPYGEHDFVAFELDGQTYFAKVDYYNEDLSGGSEDPADPEKTKRVLTIMFASDY
jgi:hypothetical protein